MILVTATPGSWFFEGLGGILPDPAKPGFKHFTLRPGIVKSVDWVNCSYQSPYGRIVSNWKREGNKLVMDITVPANTTADVYLPFWSKSQKVKMNGDVVKYRQDGNFAAVEGVGSGNSIFEVLK